MTTDQEQALADGTEALKLAKELVKRVEALENPSAVPAEKPVEVTPEPTPSEVAPAQ